MFRGCIQETNKVMNLKIKKLSIKALSMMSLVAVPIVTSFNTHAMQEGTTAVSHLATDAKQENETQVQARLQQDKQVLMSKLAQISFFSASFTQKIRNETGDVIQEGAGTIAISKPNLVNWQTTEPDETSIISDGETLWFYDPFIEQASAYTLANAIENTPILLLTSDNKTLWDNYHVEHHDDAFIISPLTQESQIKNLTLRFTVNNRLSEFTFKDATGQVSQIELDNLNVIDKPAPALFMFSLPEGVRLEDKR